MKKSYEKFRPDITLVALGISMIAVWMGYNLSDVLGVLRSATSDRVNDIETLTPSLGAATGTAGIILRAIISHRSGGDKKITTLVNRRHSRLKHLFRGHHRAQAYTHGRRQVHRSANQHNLSAGSVRGYGQSVAHFARAVIADIPYWINRFTGWPSGDHQALASQHTAGAIIDLHLFLSQRLHDLRWLQHAPWAVVTAGLLAFRRSPQANLGVRL
jgi:hypothetical protein